MSSFSFSQRTGLASLTCPGCGQSVRAQKGLCPKCNAIIDEDIARRLGTLPMAAQSAVSESAPAQPASKPAEQMVRVYKGKRAEKDMQKDSQRLAKAGWRIANVNGSTKGVGLGRVVMLGVFAFAGDRTALTVVYER